MRVVEDFCQFLEAFAPAELAEDWDNVGLLIGHRARPVTKVMTCLTVTPESVQEAVNKKAELIVTHHPFPFRSVKRITDETVVGKMLLALIQANISVYSPHTSFDSSRTGINQQLAEGLALEEIRPLRPTTEMCDPLGAGRFGSLPATSIEAFVGRVKSFLGIDGLQVVGDPQANLSRVALACGSAGEFLDAAIEAGCDLMLTGETSFHTCLEAKARGLGLVLTGHYASERFALETLADTLGKQFPDVQVWPSANEVDPVRWIG